MRYRLLVLLGGLASTAALSNAEPVSTTPLVPAGATINFRLDVASEQVTETELAIASIPNARIAEPADYRLTTKKDFPQTLMAVDARHPEENVEYVDDDDGLELRTRTIEIGSLLDHDYRKGLNALVNRASLGKAAMGLQQNSGPVETCVRPTSYDQTDAGGDRCRSGPMQFPDASPYDSPSPDDLAGISSAIIRNKGRTPVFVSLFLVDSTFAVHRLALRGQQPLSSGAYVETGEPSFSIPNGRYRLITLWSDHPIEGDSGVSGTLTPGVFASLVEYRAVEPPIGALGGGWAASLASAPWIAQIYSTYKYAPKDFTDDQNARPDKQEFLSELTDVQRAHRCGGTLIGPNLVVTAAHCVAKDDFAGPRMQCVLKKRRVRVGTTLLGRGGGTYAIVGLTVPATYNAKTHENDIALLLLSPDRDTGKLVPKTIKLATTPLVANAPVITFGWGFTGQAAATGSLRVSTTEEIQRSPDDLQMGELKALPVRQCQQDYGRELRPGMLCVSGRTSIPVFTCLGDSGGPLVRGTGAKQELVGVTSWAKGCGLPNKPDVFTDISRQAAWIQAARKVLEPGFAEAYPKVSLPAGPPPDCS